MPQAVMVISSQVRFWLCMCNKKDIVFLRIIKHLLVLWQITAEETVFMKHLCFYWQSFNFHTWSHNKNSSEKAMYIYLPTECLSIWSLTLNSICHIHLFWWGDYKWRVTIAGNLRRTESVWYHSFVASLLSSARWWGKNKLTV